VEGYPEEEQLAVRDEGDGKSKDLDQALGRFGHQRAYYPVRAKAPLPRQHVLRVLGSRESLCVHGLHVGWRPQVPHQQEETVHRGIDKVHGRMPPTSIRLLPQTKHYT
jgi:hypothetical protein